MADLPMPPPTVPLRALRSFKALSFDIYATLIDWESSIPQQLAPLCQRLPANHDLRNCSAAEQKQQLCHLFDEYEAQLVLDNPGIRYDKALSETYLLIAQRLGVSGDDAKLRTEAAQFGADVGSWQPFPDTVDAMQRLKKHFRLIALSNVDRASFTRTLDGPLKEVSFDGIYIAEDIGSYKPDLRNFDYLIEHARTDFGIEKENILHTAQALGADHVPAKQMGMSSVWIARKGQAMGGELEQLMRQGKVGFGWRFATLGEMADAVERGGEET